MSKPRRSGFSVVEHDTSKELRDRMLKAREAPAPVAAVIGRGLVGRLDHAACLGRELTRAETAMPASQPFAQDAASDGAAAPVAAAMGATCESPSCQSGSHHA